MKEWNTEKLVNIKNETLSELCASVEDSCKSVYYMYIHDNVIFTFSVPTSHSTPVMAALDKKTLKIIKQWTHLGYWYISDNGKTINLSQYNYVKDKPAGYELSIDVDTLVATKIYNIVFNELRYPNHPPPKDSKTFSYINYLSLKPRLRYYKFRNSISNQNARFYLFPDGEWILRPKGHKFQASKNVEKHLKMKTLSGKIVPINKATYQKYHTNINL